MKRYTSYKNSKVEWIGEIPSHWEISKLKLLSELTTGNTPPKKDDDNYEGGIYPWVKPDELIGLNPTNDTKEKLTKKGKSLSRVIPPYSVLVNCIGDIGKIGYSEQEVSTNQQITSIIFDDTIEKRYGLFHSYIMKDEFRRNSECVVVPILNNQKQGDCFLVIPPLPEQKKIVSFLDDKTSKIDRLIQSKKRKIELLKEKRTSLINEVVTKGLNPNVEMKDSGVEWYEKIPKHWMRGKLSYHTSRIGDGLHSTPKYVDESEYKFINGNNLINGRIKYFDSTKSVNKDEYEKHYIELTNKTILLSINGTIGNLSFYNNEKVILGKSSCYINCQDTINRSYLYYLLGSDSIMKYFTFELTGTTIYNLSLESVRNTPIPIPPLDEQKEIVQYLNSETNTIDKTVQLETDKIDLLKEYKQSLISEVVTGKVNVQEEIDGVMV